MLLAAAQNAMAPILAEHGYELIINPTLGPLKLNAPRTAVLHLMLYSREAHIEHAIASPFTCLDWQRAERWRGLRLAEVFPVFALEPRHFISGRRGLADYLNDFRARQVSYRRLEISGSGYREVRCSQPMTDRDAHEFAYHVLRFLMQNLVKLVRRRNLVLELDALVREYFAIFPADRAETESLLRSLAEKKRAQDFARPVANLDARIEAFVRGFEGQFRRMFFDSATRHVVFRHARTAFNGGQGDARVFLGRSDPEIEHVEAADFEQLAELTSAIAPQAAYSSPLARCRQTLERLGRQCAVPPMTIDERLVEIDYGALEGVAVGAARLDHAEFFDQLCQGDDPRFPAGGENTADVHQRGGNFVAERFKRSHVNTMSCTHNVVLRCLVGDALNIPRHQWHRLQIPHLAPFTFIRTREHGLFLDIPEQIERHVFQRFAAAKVDGPRQSQLPQVA